MSRRSVWLWGAILVVAFTAYLPSLRSGWVFDDYWNIVDAPSVHWDGLSGEKFRQLVSMTGNHRRVLSNFSFALNYMADGLDPRGYHLVNVLIHLGVGLALGWLVALYLRADPSRRGRDIPVAAVAAPAALFLLHPVNTQAVTYVVQRMTSLAALFCILSFAAYLKGRHAASRARSLRWFAASLVLWAAGLASKENAAVLPLVLLTWELCFGGITWRKLLEAWRRSSPGTRVAAVLTLCLVGGGVGVMGLRLLGTPASWMEPFPNRDFSGLERVLTQTRVGALYLSLILFPSPGRLNLDHDFSVSRGFLDPPTTLAASVCWVVAIVGTLVLARRKPMWGFPILAYLECHLVEAGPVNLELVFEHRLYLPLAMLSLFPAAVLVSLRGDRLRLAAGACAVLSLVLGGATFSRNLLWADPIAFHRDIAEKSPNKPRAARFLADALIKAGRPEEAIAPARRAVELDPTDYEGLLQLGTAYRAAGHPDGALAAYAKAAAVDPMRFPALFAMGLVLDASGRRDEAVQHFLDHGARLATSGSPVQAIPLLQEAVELAPESSVAHNQLGNVYGMADRMDDALVEYRRAVELDSTNVEAVYNLANVLELQGRMEEAIPYYRRFVAIAPEGLRGVVEAIRGKLAAADAASGEGPEDSR